jgi:hypothetical protein
MVCRRYRHRHLDRRLTALAASRALPASEACGGDQEETGSRGDGLAGATPPDGGQWLRDSGGLEPHHFVDVRARSLCRAVSPLHDVHPPGSVAVVDDPQISDAFGDAARRTLRLSICSAAHTAAATRRGSLHKPRSRCGRGARPFRSAYRLGLLRAPCPPRCHLPGRALLSLR